MNKLKYTSNDMLYLASVVFLLGIAAGLWIGLVIFNQGI